MSQQEYQAFTISSNIGCLHSIFTQIQVSIAEELSDIFKIQQQIVDVRALWDTGATNTSISKRLAAKLNLPPISRRTIQCAGQPYESNTYKVNLILPNHVGFKNITVTEFEDSKMFDVLVGMDIITAGDFAVTNANGQTVCSFKTPAGPDHIDYVDQINKKRKGQIMAAKYKKQQKHHRH
jgi:predicted aspartyl protease